jgi:hypothetical protein
MTEKLMMMDHQDRNLILNGQKPGFPNDAVDAVIAESANHDGGWDRVETWPKDSFEKMLAIGRDETACPHCGYHLKQNSSATKLTWLRTRGRLSGFECLSRYDCVCIFYRRFASLVYGDPAKGVIGIPKTFLRSGLLAVPERHTDRATVLKEAHKIVRENPTANFILLGPSGVGKSSAGYYLTLMAFIRQAWIMFEAGEVYVTPSVFHTTLTRLLSDHKDAEINKGVKPSINEKAIYAAAAKDRTPFLFLEELDKMPKVTEHRSSVFTAIIDAMYANKGQMVLTSNLRPKAFRQFLDGITEEFVICRKSTESGGGKRKTYVLNFFATTPGDLVLDPSETASWPGDEDRIVRNNTKKPATTTPAIVTFDDDDPLPL